MIIKIKPADSRYERGTEGGQVTGLYGDARQTVLAVDFWEVDREPWVMEAVG
jgi:hypothetical protein